MALTGCLLALLVGAGPATPSAGASTRVSAWLPYWVSPVALTNAVETPGVLSVVSPFWYDAGADGIHAHPGAESPAALEQLRDARVRVVPTVTSSLGPEAIAQLATRPVTRALHVRRLVKLAMRHGYDGLDLDYERMAHTTSRVQAKRTRRGFTALVRDACRALRAVRARCVVSVMPRTGRAPVVWLSQLIPAVYDYAAIARAADRMRVMAYDQHTRDTAAGPIAGIDWVERVARYAAATAPAAKVELGIPLYGRDWGGERVTSFAWQQARELRRRHAAPRRWDARTASPHFRYTLDGRVHDVWYSDARSTLARFRLARRFGFAGVALWAIGQEDPATWEALRAAARR